MKPPEPPEFLRTIYLGDRACRAIRIESWRAQVVLEVNLISRIRSATGAWEFYSAEDVPNGRVVFTGVERVQFDPSGPVPNDLINEISARLGVNEDDKKRWFFELSIGSVTPKGSTIEIIVQVIGEGVHLEDPARPGIEIRE